MALLSLARKLITRRGQEAVMCKDDCREEHTVDRERFWCAAGACRSRDVGSEHVLCNNWQRLSGLHLLITDPQVRGAGTWSVYRVQMHACIHDARASDGHGGCPGFLVCGQLAEGS